MTRPTDPSRPGGAPTVREIAELTSRLREISARGRDVDPAERAAFLADKDALLARIAHANHDHDPDHGQQHDDAARRMTAMGYGPPVPLVELEHVDDGDPSSADLVEQPHRSVGCLVEVEPGAARPDDEQRREQLAEWHAHDQAAEDCANQGFVCGGYYPDLERD